MQQGQLRALAVTTAKRSPAAPDVPTWRSRLPGFDVSGWYAFFVPAKTPAEIVRKMHADTVAALADPTTEQRLETSVCSWSARRPKSSAVSLKAEMDKWAPVIKEAGISIRD